MGWIQHDSTTKTIALAAGVGKTDGWTTARVNENWDVACLPMGSDGWGRGWNRGLKLLRGLTCINFKQLLGFDSGLIISLYIYIFLNLRITDPHWSHWFRFRFVNVRISHTTDFASSLCLRASHFAPETWSSIFDDSCHDVKMRSTVMPNGEAQYYNPHDYQTWVEIQWTHPLWYNRRGHRLDVKNPSMVSRRFKLDAHEHT